jgi:hypothetical protein
MSVAFCVHLGACLLQILGGVVDPALECIRLGASSVALALNLCGPLGMRALCPRKLRLERSDLLPQLGHLSFGNAGAIPKRLELLPLPLQPCPGLLNLGLLLPQPSFQLLGARECRIALRARLLARLRRLRAALLVEVELQLVHSVLQALGVARGALLGGHPRVERLVALALGGG